MGAVLSFLPMLLTIAGDLPKVMGAIQFLGQAVITVESRTLSGPDKLTAVLNEFEAYLRAEFPQWAGEFQTIATDVEAVVNEIVSVFNAFAKPANPA